MTTEERIKALEALIELIEQRLGILALICQVRSADLTEYKESEQPREQVWQYA